MTRHLLGYAVVQLDSDGKPQPVLGGAGYVVYPPERWKWAEQDARWYVKPCRVVEVYAEIPDAE